MIYGYARCSTNEKLQDIERQVRLMGSNRSLIFCLQGQNLKQESR